MGAYENPPIIQEPDLGSIWNRNFKAAQVATAAAFAPSIEFQRQEKLRKEKRNQTAAKLRKEAGNTAPALTKFSMQGADRLFKANKDLASGAINNTDFLEIQGKEFGFVTKIAANGKALRGFSEELAGKKISNYQTPESAKGLAFLSAFNEQRFNSINEEDGALNITFSDPNGESATMKESEYTDPSTYNINEVFDTAETIETGVNLLESHLTKMQDVSKYDLKSGGVGIVKTQKWDKDELNNVENRINFVQNSSFMKELTTPELGSYLEDTLKQEIKDITKDPAYIKIVSGLSEKEKSVVNKYALEGFIDVDIELGGGQKINPSQYLSAYAKRKIAESIVNEGPEATKTKDIDTSSKTIEASLKARSGSGRAKPEVVSLVQNTFDGLIYSLERAEASGGDTNALAEFFNNVKSPSGGTFSPNAAGSDGVLYDSVANVIQIPTVINAKTGDFRVEEYRLDEPLGLEKLFTSVLSSRGVAKKDLPSAVNAFVETYSEFDPNIKLLSEENTDTEKPSLP